MSLGTEKDGAWATHDPDLLKRWEAYEYGAFKRGQNIAALIEKATGVSDAKILDMGGGSGGVSAALANRCNTVVCMDIKHSRLHNGKIRLDRKAEAVHYCCADALLLPFDSNSFDVIVLNDLIEHVPDSCALIAESSRVLKPGGLVYLSAPNALSIKNILDEPHYGLFGIHLLPHAWAAFYVTRIRRRCPYYDVYRFPTFGWVIKHFKSVGIHMQLVASDYSVQQIIKIERPENIQNKFIKRMIRIINLLKLDRFIKFFLILKIIIKRQNLEFIGFKTSEPLPPFIDLSEAQP